MKLKEFTRRFISADADLSNPDTVNKEFDKVSVSPVAGRAELEEFVARWMEINSCARELETQYYTAMTCDTANKDAEGKYLHMVEEVMPVLEKRNFDMKKIFVGSPALTELPPLYDVFIRNVRNEMDLFCEENIPLKTEDAKLSQRYQKTAGSWLAEWEGEKLTVQAVRAKLQETDRAVREKAFFSAEGPHLKDRASLDGLYDEMLKVRGQIAKNSDFKDFRDYQFRNYARFDYAPEDCFEFHKAIKSLIVPLVSETAARKKAKLNLDCFRPWDALVDEDGRPPIKPFESAAELIEKVHSVAKKIDDELGFFFGVMREKNLLDLDSRKGKAPGGYMADFPERRLPFIFMNAVGTARDVDTLLHESGHAYHLFLAREIEPVAYLSAPMEFAEVASMSMELLARPYFDLIYKPEEVEVIKKRQLQDIMKFFPFMAMLDSFQHWVYTNPTTEKSRGEYWETLENEFRPHIDWSGIEEHKRKGWQYLHVFQVPFYYVEYGIAQLGALQVWLNSLKDYKNSVRMYKEGLALGGSKPLPQLFEAAGAKFDMSEANIKPLVEAITKELGQ